MALAPAVADSAGGWMAEGQFAYCVFFDARRRRLVRPGLASRKTRQRDISIEQIDAAGRGIAFRFSS